MSTAALLGRLRIDFEVQTGKLQAGMNQANKSIDSMSKRLINLNNVMLGVAGAAGFGQLIGGMINATNKTIAWEAGMLAATGSLSAAKLEMGHVRKAADNIGIGLSRASDEFVKLANAARGTALEGETIRELFEAVSLAGRTFNLTADDMGGSFRALTQMLSKGVVSMEEWRQQFSERIPGAMQAGANAMGLTVMAFSDLISSGTLLTTDFLPKLIPELNRLTEAGAEMAKNMPSAHFARLGNAVFEFGQAIGNSGVVGLIANIAIGLTEIVKVTTSAIPKIADLARTVGILGVSLAGAFVTGKIVAGIKAATVALGGFNLMFAITAGSIGTGLTKIGVVLTAVTGIAKRFWLAIGGPIGAAVLIAGGIWSIVAAHKANKEAMERELDTQRDLNNAAREGHDIALKQVRIAFYETRENLRLAAARLKLLETRKKELEQNSGQSNKFGGTGLDLGTTNREIKEQKEAVDQLTKSLKDKTDALEAGRLVNLAVRRGEESALASTKSLGIALREELQDRRAAVEFHVNNKMVVTDESRALRELLQDKRAMQAQSATLSFAYDKEAAALKALHSELLALNNASRQAASGTGELHKQIDRTGIVTRKFRTENEAAAAAIQAAADDATKAAKAAADAAVRQYRAWSDGLLAVNNASRQAAEGHGELHKEINSSGILIRRFKNEIDDEADAHTNAATAIEIHVTAMERLAAATSGAAREAAGLVGNLNGILTSFGGSFPQGGQIASQFSAVSNLSGLFGSSNLAGGLSDLLTSAGTEGAKSGFLSGRTAGFLNEAAGNLRGTSDAAIGLSGAAGGIGATAAFGSGGYVGTGASIGGLFGALFGASSLTPFGPAIGAAAGSFIGGGIGSLFGSNQDKPKVAIQSLPFGTGPDGTFGQRSFIGTTPFSQIMAGGRDGAGLSDSMIALVTGIQQMDTTLAEFMSPEQIARAQQAAQGIGGIETRADRFSAGPVIFQRAEVLIRAAGEDLLELFEKFKPSEQSLKAFIDSLGILTEMGQSATEIAASFDMANEGFRELIAMVAGFEEFTGTTLQDVQDSLDFLNQTPMMAFDSATTALFEAMEAFDGTEEATRRLNASLGAFAKTEIAVLQDLNRLRESTASSIASTVQTVRFLGMTPEQIWEESRVGANALLAGIQNGTITDPQAVAAASQQALGFFNTGFGTLSGEQQLAQRGDALAFLEALNVASSDAYAVAEEKIAQIHIDATTQMTNSLDRAAQSIIDAAARLQAPPAPVIEVQYTDTVFVPGDGGKEVNA